MKTSKIEKKMLERFATGWVVSACNQVPGSWNTYYSLVRKGLIETVQTQLTVLSSKGQLELSKTGEINGHRKNIK